MSKSETIVESIVKNKVQLLITLGTVAIGLLNFLIASRLAPIYQDIILNRTRIEACEEQVKTFVPRVELDSRLQSICDRLKAIEEKVDTLLIRSN